MYDVVIIGSGPGGMTAALYASRADLKVLVLERGIYGGQMQNTAEVENYPGMGMISGPELSEKMYQDSNNFGAEHAYGYVTGIEVNDTHKTVVTDDNRYETKTVIIATGAEHRKLGTPGEDEFAGRGVSYCAVCDGAFFRNQHLAVIGGGDSAVEEGAYLTQMASKVTVIHRRDELRAQKILQDRAFKNEKMDFIWNKTVETIQGDDNKVNALQLVDTQTGETSTLEVDGVFIYVGLVPITEHFSNLGITDEEGWVITNEKMETTMPGIYAIGDVRKTVLRQITTAVGDGSIAGQEVYKYIESLND
ncbi:thioredoxin-disulfide reductase [Vagococcus xieshaowenii]|uniref:Thioredoxin reductase n=1 Tax=Vagococcus xieshaowenii TaxID=2562451 RepID=A0AAJ5JL58_9ENTE|nr:thioredoxin-disulfide reductase [Vagococcus xieshaowenii]QCA28651.1 thioredoxin-disulfide reductase [Vagococcus xieshaowenii]TFZ40671.1 thioredoxin-disulfide reductase [Vagococcus xieshaowenii]